MKLRVLPAVLAVGLLLPLAAMTAASAHHPEGPGSHGWTDYDPADGPASNEDPKDQHGPDEGHLPPSNANVDLVAVEELTSVKGGIADVGYYKGYAYLNAFAPECVGRPGA